MLIGQQAFCLGRVVLLLATTRIYKNGDYELQRPFHGAQNLLDLLHECRQLPLEFIAQKNFDSELQQINAGLV